MVYGTLALPILALHVIKPASSKNKPSDSALFSYPGSFFISTWILLIHKFSACVIYAASIFTVFFSILRRLLTNRTHHAVTRSSPVQLLKRDSSITRLILGCLCLTSMKHAVVSRSFVNLSSSLSMTSSLTSILTGQSMRSLSNHPGPLSQRDLISSSRNVGKHPLHGRSATFSLTGT